MNPFNGILPFVQVAETRSFTRAGEQLGVSAAAVSKAVRQLEAELGVKLFERTSRTVALTREGEAFFPRAREAVALVNAGRQAAAAGQREPAGPVVLSAPFILSKVLMPAFAALRQRYPAMSLQLRFTDRHARLAEEQVDAALRIGDVGDERLVARTLFRPRWMTAASPAYLAKAGVPRRVEDLAQHACLRFVTPRGTERGWTFRGATAPEPVRRAFDANYGEALVHAAIAGVGVVQAFDFMLAEHVAAGRLVEVLADRAAEGPEVLLVYPSSRRSSSRMRALSDALAEKLRRP